MTKNEKQPNQNELAAELRAHNAATRATAAYVRQITHWATGPDAEVFWATYIGGNAVLFERRAYRAAHDPLHNAPSAFVFAVNDDAEVTINGIITEDYDHTLLALADYVTQGRPHVGKRYPLSVNDVTEN